MVYKFLFHALDPKHPWWYRWLTAILSLVIFLPGVFSDRYSKYWDDCLDRAYRDHVELQVLKLKENKS